MYDMTKPGAWSCIYKLEIFNSGFSLVHIFFNDNIFLTTRRGFYKKNLSIIASCFITVVSNSQLKCLTWGLSLSPRTSC